MPRRKTTSPADVVATVLWLLQETGAEIRLTIAIVNAAVDQAIKIYPKSPMFQQFAPRKPATTYSMALVEAINNTKPPLVERRRGSRYLRVSPYATSHGSEVYQTLTPNDRLIVHYLTDAIIALLTPR